jgi:hypothetical protein
MKTITPRSLSSVEIALIRGALERASVGPVPDEMVAGVAGLMVVGECECGCHSLYIQPPASGDYRIADGVGYSPSGQRVEVLVWASSKSVSALEIVDHAGAGELPDPTSVCSWEAAGVREAKTHVA